MMPSLLRRTALPLVILAVVGCRSPKADAAIAEQLQQMADELNAVRQDNAATVEQLDSLRLLVARQDTLLRQLAGMAGVPVPTR
jgi:hypothetical protein